MPILTQEAAPQYRALDDEARHALQQRYQAARDAYPAILDAWQKTLTPEMIRRENTVRANRRKAGLSRKRALRIDGEPKKPITPFFRCVERRVRLGEARDRMLGVSNRGFPCAEQSRIPFSHRFCNEIRAEGSNSSVLQGEADVTKQSTLLAQAWKALTEDERKVSNPRSALFPLPLDTCSVTVDWTVPGSIVFLLSSRSLSCSSSVHRLTISSSGAP